MEKYLNILAKHINVNWNISEYYIKGIKEILDEHKREIYSKMEKARNERMKEPDLASAVERIDTNKKTGKGKSIQEILKCATGIVGDIKYYKDQWGMFYRTNACALEYDYGDDEWERCIMARDIFSKEFVESTREEYLIWVKEEQEECEESEE